MKKFSFRFQNSFIFEVYYVCVSQMFSSEKEKSNLCNNVNVVSENNNQKLFSVVNATSNKIRLDNKFNNKGNTSFVG